MIITLLLVAEIGLASKQNPLFPSFGTGPVEVRIYTDYFCPPCQAMEPAAEPLLKDLLKKNAIRLIIVDTPFNQQTPLFAKYFLYAHHENKTADHAFRVRNILLELSANRQVTTSQERIEDVFKERGIPFTVYDVKPVFDRFNAMIREDKINATPSCVIIKGGQRKTFVGGVSILNALKALP